MDLGASSLPDFNTDAGLFAYLLPGIIVVFLYMEYVSLGTGLAADRNYGILEPVFLSPIRRHLWLFGAALSVLPTGLLAAGSFVLSSILIFGIHVPHPGFLALLILLVILTSLPWGMFVCSIFLCGRNMRLLYALFETPSEFLSGARFPIASLPLVLSTIAMAYPLSHAVRLLRIAWMDSISWASVFFEITWLVSLDIFLFIVATLLFRWAEERGKQKGTLTFA